MNSSPLLDLVLHVRMMRKKQQRLEVVRGVHAVLSEFSPVPTTPTQGLKFEFLFYADGSDQVHLDVTDGSAGGRFYT